MSKLLIIVGVILIALVGWLYASGDLMTYVDEWFGSQEPPKKIGMVAYLPILKATDDGFKKGMEELGYKEGRDVIYDYRDVQGDYGAMKEVSKEFINNGVDLIFGNPGEGGVEAKKAADELGSSVP